MRWLYLGEIKEASVECVTRNIAGDPPDRVVVGGVVVGAPTYGHGGDFGFYAVKDQRAVESFEQTFL